MSQRAVALVVVSALFSLTVECQVSTSRLHVRLFNSAKDAPAKLPVHSGATVNISSVALEYGCEVPGDSTGSWYAVAKESPVLDTLSSHCLHQLSSWLDLASNTWRAITRVAEEAAPGLFKTTDNVNNLDKKHGKSKKDPEFSWTCAELPDDDSGDDYGSGYMPPGPVPGRTGHGFLLLLSDFQKYEIFEGDVVYLKSQKMGKFCKVGDARDSYVVTCHEMMYDKPEAEFVITLAEPLPPGAGGDDSSGAWGTHKGHGGGGKGPVHVKLYLQAKGVGMRYCQACPKTGVVHCNLPRKQGPNTMSVFDMVQENGGAYPPAPSGGGDDASGGSYY